jgi:hypothetical protein
MQRPPTSAFPGIIMAFGFWGVLPISFGFIWAGVGLFGFDLWRRLRARAS